MGFSNRTTPDLCSILLPLYKWWQLPYYYAGCKMYDLLAGSQNMESAYWMGKSRALENFPMLKADGLVGGVVYYDGEPSRRNLSKSAPANTPFRSTQRFPNEHLPCYDCRSTRCCHGQPRRGHCSAQEARCFARWTREDQRCYAQGPNDRRGVHRPL